MSAGSPYWRASRVSDVHDGYRLEEAENWPFMRTPLNAPQPPPQRPLAVPAPLPAQAVSEDPYTTLSQADVLKTSIGISKDVFKVREVTKLLLFVGLAAGSILFLDISIRLIIATATIKCNKQ
jgi:hypothetical protein